MDDRYASHQAAMAHLATQAQTYTGMPQPPDVPGPEHDGRKQEIGDILQQIMNITDQSLDEAQARSVVGYTIRFSARIHAKLNFYSQ